MPKLKKKSESQKLAERRRRREDPQLREVERAADAEARRVVREDPQRHEIEKAANTEARRAARQDEERRNRENAARRVARQDEERRNRENAARRVAREEPQRHDIEKTVNTEARRVARQDEERRNIENAALRVARQDEERRNRENAAQRVAREDPQRRGKERAENSKSRGEKRKTDETRTLENESRKRIRIEKTKKNRSEYSNLLNSFQKRISCGPSFICSCCGGLWYESSLTKTSREKLMLRGCEETFVDTVLHVDQDVHRLCSTCKNSVYKNSIPRLCLSNGFDFPEIPDELKDLSPLEERLVALRLPFMQIRLVGSEKQSLLRGNVVNVENDLNVCAAVLPRRFDDTSTIQVKLMRKMNYTTPYMYETIRPLKVYQAAKYLIDSEVYKSENVILCDDWSRCENGDVFEYDLNAPDPDNREDDEEEITDPGVGETLIFSEKQDASDFIGIRIAPAEGNTPIALYRDQNAEVMSFPTIYCGRERKFKNGIKISYTDIAKSELRRYDRRCCLPSKVLYSFKRSFNEKVMQAIQICLRKTTGNENLTAGSVLKLESVRNLLESDDGYAVFKHLRSSPSYWKEQTKKVLAMVRQLGKPALFITLSAAETKWIELIGMLHKIKTRTDITEEDIQALPFDEIAKLIREDPVTCMRHFEHRLRALQNLLFKPEGGIFAPYQLKDHFDRGEFQMRGSPHDHGLYWIENAPVYNEDDENAVSACEEFVDHLITCERNESGQMDKLIGYQLHKHSHTCTKRTRKCRFGFPKPPLDRTRILSPLPKDFDTRLRKNAEEVLNKVKDACEKLGRHFKEIIPFETFLESLDVSYEDYYLALRSSIKRVTVFLKRSTNAIFINAYNTKLLEAWGANIDVQFVIDTFACAKYCVGYILKGEGGVSKLLQTLTHDVKRGNTTARDQVKRFANILINGSEISAQEATGFLLGMPNTHSTRQDIFINTAHPDNRISMLKPSEELQELDEGSQDIRVKGLIDHYISRPEELEDISLAEFASMYEYSKTCPPTKTGDEDDDARAIQNKIKSQRFKLLDKSGFVRKRTVRKVIRYRHFGKKEDPKNYWREQLMLFIPWRNEETELLSIDSISKAKQLYNVILENSQPFIFNRDVDDNFLNDLMHEFDADDLQLPDPEALEDDDEENLDQEGLTYNEEFNELDSSTYKVDQFLPPKLIDESQYLKIMRSLNEKQRRFVLHTLHLLKANSLPFYVFLSGGAGVGKSHVITATVQSYLRFFCKIPTTNPESICVLVSAPTGKAAFNVFGMTLHCTFKLPPTQYGGRVNNLDDGPVNSLRMKLEKTKLFIIDEISMVSVKQLDDIDQRLRQIFCSTEEFGGKSLLVVGHLRQLPPIGGSYVFKPPNNIPLGELVGNHLWEKFALFEFEEIMRQRGELQFCKALNNMAEGVMDNADVELIRCRQVGDNNQPPKEAIRLFQTNNECSIFNSEIHRELGTDGAISVAFDKIQGAGTDSQKRQLKEYAKTLDRQKTDGLPYETPLQVGGEYFVSTNIDVQDGLFNGSTGSLKLIEYGKTADSRVPIRAWVDFRHPLIGIKKKRTCRSYQQQKRINADWVGIDRITRNLSKTQRHGAMEIIRKQIPLIPANGMTIAKSQGSTMTSVVVHVNKYNGKGNLLPIKGRPRKLTRENLYVACSRSTTLKGLFIEGDFVPPSKPGPQDPVTMEMDRLRSIPFNFSIKFLQDFDDTYEKIYFHNVQSFIAHSPDVMADNCCLASNFICFVEPHVLAADSFEIPNFKCIHRLNCRNNRNSEGALMFEKVDTGYRSCTFKQYYSIAGHCLFVLTNISSVNVIMTYKSPKYSSSLFKQKLSEIITPLQMKIILFGDININLQSVEGKPIIEMLSKFGLTSKLNVEYPSTDGGTHIDCCFSNFLEMDAWFYECYYSYHKPICIVWPKI